MKRAGLASPLRGHFAEDWIITYFTALGDSNALILRFLSSSNVLISWFFGDF